MIAAPLFIVVILVVLAALVAPLIPMRRRRGGIAGLPVVTGSLIFLNVLFFAANAITVQDPSGGHIVLSPFIARHWGMIPRHASVVTLFSHIFLHGSWFHLLGNMLGLWLFGPHVEEALGRLEYTLFYLGSGVAAGLLHLVIAAILLPTAAAVPLVGASGAIFGVLGLFAVRFWRAKVRVFLFFQIPAIWAVGAFALLQVIYGVMSVADGGASDSTANWAHVGGFLFGMVIALPLKMREDSRVEYELEDAEKAARTGRLDQAAAHYRAVIDATPADAAAHHSLGRVCIQLRQGEAAHRHLMDALRLYLRGGESLKAARVYEDAISGFETFPLPPELLQRVASACEEAQQFPLALGALSELCRDHPAAREAEMGLIRLGKLHLQKLNQPQNAIGIFSEFLRMYPTSEWAGHALRLREEAVQEAARSGSMPASRP